MWGCWVPLEEHLNFPLFFLLHSLVSIGPFSLVYLAFDFLEPTIFPFFIMRYFNGFLSTLITSLERCGFLFNFILNLSLFEVLVWGLLPPLEIWDSGGFYSSSSSSSWVSTSIYFPLMIFCECISVWYFSMGDFLAWMEVIAEYMSSVEAGHVFLSLALLLA